MKMNPYLLFNGQCAAAFQFYELVPGGKTTLHRFGIPWMVGCHQAA